MSGPNTAEEVLLCRSIGPFKAALLKGVCSKSGVNGTIKALAQVSIPVALIYFVHYRSRHGGVRLNVPVPDHRTPVGVM